MSAGQRKVVLKQEAATALATGGSNQVIRALIFRTVVDEEKILVFIGSNKSQWCIEKRLAERSPLALLCYCYAQPTVDAVIRRLQARHKKRRPNHSTISRMSCSKGTCGPL